MAVEVDHKLYATPLVRFGPFEMDLRSGELRKSRVRVRLQAQPFRVLSVLVERAGEVVSREELRRHLWGDETTVDFDHGLDIAVNKIREVLEDDADNPRFIETLSKRGYRFIAAVTAVEDTSAWVSHKADTPEPHSELRVSNDLERRKRDRRRLLWLLAGAISGALVVALPILFLRTEHAHIRPLRIREVTYSRRVYPGLPLQESLAQMATDGSRLYFPQIESRRAVLSQATLAMARPHAAHLFFDSGANS